MIFTLNHALRGHHHLKFICKSPRTLSARIKTELSPHHHVFRHVVGSESTVIKAFLTLLIFTREHKAHSQTVLCREACVFLILCAGCT